MNIGNPSIPTITGEFQKHSQASTLASRPVNMPPMVPSPQTASTANLTSASLLSLLDTSESNSNYVTNLVKPSSFSSMPPAAYPLMVAAVPSSMPTAPPLHPPNLQRPYGTPVLQPFPPPVPPPSLTPTTAATPKNGLAISRDKVREALMLLAQVGFKCVHDLS